MILGHWYLQTVGLKYSRNVMKSKVCDIHKSRILLSITFQEELLGEHRGACARRPHVLLLRTDLIKEFDNSFPRVQTDRSWGWGNSWVGVIVWACTLCQTLSKAWEMSRNAAEQYWLLSSASFKTRMMRWVFSIVECLGRNPNWWLGMRLACSTSEGRRLRRNFSKNLAAMGKRLMGLYEDSWWGGLPSFGMSMIWATFHWEGK
jgi:hypothetical protein